MNKENGLLKLLSKLALSSVLWISFVTTMIITITFPFLAGIWEITLLDSIVDPAEARAVIANMSDSQRYAHAWITGTVDVAYPIAYGALFIGSAFRCFPKSGWLLAIPSMILVPIDLVEGVVQILALLNIADWVSSKAILTSSKFVLIVIGVVITLCGWLKWIISRVFVKGS